MEQTRKPFTDEHIENTNGRTTTERMERAYWLLCGIEQLARDIANEQCTDSAEDAAEIIQALTWYAQLEIGAVQEAALKAFV